MPKKGLTLEEQVDEILKQAEEKGASTNFFFKTTFKRYQVQIKILKELEGAIKEYGATVTKEYVKGRANLSANPAISEYNKTATAANGTVATLINILRSMSDESAGGSKLRDMINALNGTDDE